MPDELPDYIPEHLRHLSPEELEKLEDAYWVKEAEKAVREAKEKGEGTMSWEDVKRDLNL
jgi:hypothetical protein